jgi:hypothetical protein
MVFWPVCGPYLLGKGESIAHSVMKREPTALTPHRVCFSWLYHVDCVLQSLWLLNLHHQSRTLEKCLSMPTSRSSSQSSYHWVSCSGCWVLQFSYAEKVSISFMKVPFSTSVPNCCCDISLSVKFLISLQGIVVFLPLIKYHSKDFIVIKGSEL